MNSLSLMQQRKRWQQRQNPSFSLRQTGRKNSAPSPIQLSKYAGYNNGHFIQDNSIRLTNLNNGGLKAGETVLVVEGFLIGRSRGSEVF